MSERKFTGKKTSAFKFESIRYEKKAGRATITFNRPKVLNAINHQVLSELNLALKDVSWDDEIAVLVLTGEGERAFCAGADLNEQKQFLQRPRDYWKWMGDFIEVHERLLPGLRLGSPAGQHGGGRPYGRARGHTGERCTGRDDRQGDPLRRPRGARSRKRPVAFVPLVPVGGRVWRDDASLRTR